MMGYREQKCREEVKTGEVMRTFLLSDRDKYIDGFSGLFLDINHFSQYGRKSIFKEI